MKKVEVTTDNTDTQRIIRDYYEQLYANKGFPCGSDGKETTCNVGDLGLIPGSGRSLGGGHGDSLQYSCLENLHGQRSLVDCSP